MSFGYGPHWFLGVNIARLEGKVCLEQLLKRFPKYGVDLAGAERHSPNSFRASGDCRS
jgi:cytochrome P450